MSHGFINKDSESCIVAQTIVNLFTALVLDTGERHESSKYHIRLGWEGREVHDLPKFRGLNAPPPPPPGYLED